MPFPSIENNTGPYDTYFLERVILTHYLIPTGLNNPKDPPPFLNSSFWRLPVLTFFLEDMTLRLSPMVLNDPFSISSGSMHDVRLTQLTDLKNG